MMRIDAYTHFIPTRFYKEVLSKGSHADIGKRMLGIPSIYDVKVRLKIVDKFKDYAQVLSYGMPPLEVMAPKPAQAEEYAKIINDGFAELCAQHPDHFPGWVAQIPLTAPDAGVGEAKRALKNGALGVQIYTNVSGRPLDDPAFAPFWKEMNKNGKPIWLHPSRSAKFSDYATEDKVEVRNLVDVRLVVRDRSGDVAAYLLQDHGQAPEPEDHHPPLRRHRADAGRADRARLGPDRRAHLR